LPAKAVEEGLESVAEAGDGVGVEGGRHQRVGLGHGDRRAGRRRDPAHLVTIADTSARHSQLTSVAASTVHGYRTALLVCAAISLAATFTGLLLPGETASGPVAGDTAV
jgi:hypothetical protein